MAERKRVLILATGGTIAGTGAAGATVGYAPGQICVDDLIAEVPQLHDIAELETRQVCNVNSDDITADVWLELARTIDEQAARPDLDGFVVTHGTDTMDETAYFLSLVLNTDKPVVLTGSMRPNTATSADGPMNLYQSVVVAADEKSRGKGVLVAFSGRIYSARDVQKTSTHSVVSMSGGENGSCGVIRDEVVLYTSTSTKLHTIHTEFSAQEIAALPKVAVIYFNVDADAHLIPLIAQHCEGLVVAGAGAGEFSKAYVAQLEKLDIPVVVSSRVGSGVVMGKHLLCANGIPANDLPPYKAAILLRLALTKTQDRTAIERFFQVY